MYNHGACSPGMFSAALDAAAQDRRGLEQVQGKAPKTKAKVVRMGIQEIMYFTIKMCRGSTTTLALCHGHEQVQPLSSRNSSLVGEMGLEASAVDSRVTRVWTAQVHSYMDFFNKYSTYCICLFSYLRFS